MLFSDELLDFNIREIKMIIFFRKMLKSAAHKIESVYLRQEDLHEGK